MSPVPPTGRRTRCLLLVHAAVRASLRGAPAALVAALVVGILGMHALDGHGTPVAATAAALAPSAEPHDAHPHVAGSTRPDPAAGPGTGVPAGSGHDLGSMVILCVVMLAVAALTLLALLAVGTRRRLTPTAFHPAAAPVRVLRRARGTGPPPRVAVLRHQVLTGPATSVHAALVGRVGPGVAACPTTT